MCGRHRCEHAHADAQLQVETTEHITPTLGGARLYLSAAKHIILSLQLERVSAHAPAHSLFWSLSEAARTHM